MHTNIGIALKPNFFPLNMHFLKTLFEFEIFIIEGQKYLFSIIWSKMLSSSLYAMLKLPKDNMIGHAGVRGDCHHQKNHCATNLEGILYSAMQISKSMFFMKLFCNCDFLFKKLNLILNERRYRHRKGRS